MLEPHAIHGWTALLKLGFLALIMALPSALVASPPSRMMVVAPTQHPAIARDLVARAGEVNRMPADPLVLTGAQGTDPQRLAAAVREQPSFGVLPLATYLRLQGSQDVELIGSSQARTRFVLVSHAGRNHCPAQSVAISSAADQTFVNRVVAPELLAGQRVRLVESATPLADVLTGAVPCAMVEQHEMARFSGLQHHFEIVRSSRDFPRAVVVAFARTSARERASFRTHLPEICSGRDGLCEAAGLQGFMPLRRGGLRREVRAYERASR